MQAKTTDIIKALEVQLPHCIRFEHTNSIICLTIHEDNHIQRSHYTAESHLHSEACNSKDHRNSKGSPEPICHRL